MKGQDDFIPMVELAVLVIFFSLVVLWVWLVARNKRLSQFVFPRRVLPLCQDCGYDLRASEYRCPECGEPTPAAKFDADAFPEIRKWFDADLERAVALAYREARLLGHDYLGTEHLLLGIVAAQPTSEQSGALATFREEVANLTSGDAAGQWHRPLAVTPEVQRTMLRAVTADEAGNGKTITIARLLAALRAGEGVAAHLLADETGAGPPSPRAAGETVEESRSAVALMLDRHK